MMQRHQTGQIRKAFTLIEILVVLLIIGLLAAILFPVVNGAKERAYQSNCASNLHQIYLAVELYKNDEGNYPPNLAALLPNTDELADGSLNTSGKGYFKGGKDALVCPDDDMPEPPVGFRSSYGNVGDPSTADFGNYVWNYWGYRVDAGTNCSDADVSGCKGTAYMGPEYGSLSEVQGYPNPSDPNPTTYANSAYLSALASYKTDHTPPQYPYLINPNDSTSDIDITKLPRLANRFAPPTTIITHCVFHRLPTSNVVGNYDIYNSDGSGQGAKDIILRLDGTAEVLDVSGASFADSSNWALQRF